MTLTKDKWLAQQSGYTSIAKIAQADWILDNTARANWQIGPPTIPYQGKSKGQAYSDALDDVFCPVARPGGYPVVAYYECETLCMDCARKIYLDEMTKAGGEIMHIDIYYEGPVEHCADCGAEIESAYGDVE